MEFQRREGRIDTCKLGFEVFLKKEKRKKREKSIARQQNPFPPGVCNFLHLQGKGDARATERLRENVKKGGNSFGEDLATMSSPSRNPEIIHLLVLSQVSHGNSNP